MPEGKGLSVREERGPAASGLPAVRQGTLGSYAVKNNR